MPFNDNSNESLIKNLIYTSYLKGIVNKVHVCLCCVRLYLRYSLNSLKNAEEAKNHYCSVSTKRSRRMKRTFPGISVSWRSINSALLNTSIRAQRVTGRPIFISSTDRMHHNTPRMSFTPQTQSYLSTRRPKELSGQNVVSRFVGSTELLNA